MLETQVQFLGQDDPLGKEMAIHSSILAWRIPWTEEPGRLRSLGSQESDMTEHLNHTIPRNEKDTFFWVLVLGGLVGLHRTVKLLQHYWSGHTLDYCDVEWLTLEMNRDHSLVFEIASKYCISDCFVDYDGYSISSKGVLPTVVDIMVIWVKFTHSSPF